MNKSRSEQIERKLGCPDLRSKSLCVGLLRRIITPASWFGINKGTNKKYWIVNGQVQKRD